MNEDFYELPQSRGNGFDGINDGDYVRCVIIKEGFPAQYLKRINDENETETKEAKQNGIDPELKLPNHKEGGIQMSIAVTEKLKPEVMGGKTGKWEEVWKRQGDKLIEPPYRYQTAVSMLPPATLYAGTRQQLTKGLTGIGNDGRINIGSILPPAFPVKDWDSGKIKDAEEKQRLANVKNITDEYASLSEEEAYKWLNSNLARNLVLAYSPDPSSPPSLMRPRVGVAFEARVKRKGDSKYFDLERFKWNNDPKGYEIFGDLYAWIDDETIELAKSIVEISNENALARKASAIKEEAPEVADEIPF